MAQPSIRADLDEALDVHLNIAAQIALNHVALEDVTDHADLGLR